MTYQDIKDKCKHGYTAMIPGWNGYLDWDYSVDQIYFHDRNYTLTERELEDSIQNRTDLYYII